MTEACARVAGRMTLMGNVPPLDVGVRGSPADVAEATRSVLRDAGDHPLILSVGGGVSPGMPAANIHAMSKTLEDFTRR
jgi:uroporphyrinogen decarboxylase